MKYGGAQNAQDWIIHLEQSFSDAERGVSKLSKDILALNGMSGCNTRHFYNNICSKKDTRYLEIGCWGGSTLASAMFQNNMTCVAVDNWSEFGGPKKEFQKVFDAFKGSNMATFYESDCWNASLIKSLRDCKFNVYMYDGNHSYQAHYDAIMKYLPCMDQMFVLIVDDWNWIQVRQGTEAALRDSNVTIHWQIKVRMSTDNSTTHGKNSWWNGMACFLLEQSSQT